MIDHVAEPTNTAESAHQHGFEVQEMLEQPARGVVGL